MRIEGEFAQGRVFCAQGREICARLRVVYEEIREGARRKGLLGKLKGFDRDKSSPYLGK